MFSVDEIQTALKRFGIDAWLLYDFRGNNPLARRVLELSDDHLGTRRFFYLIPANGSPHKLVHRIESSILDSLPGDKLMYLKWQELEAGIQELVSGHKSVAMEYSPKNAIPYVSTVDAGTVELVTSFGPMVVSSANLIQQFEATLTDEQHQQHLAAEAFTTAAFDLAWQVIADAVTGDGQTDEKSIQQVILDHFAKHDLVTSHPPIVAVDSHSGDPHYETGTGKNTTIQHGSFVLIDLWAKTNTPAGVYSDLTRVGYVGETVPEQYEARFQIVAAARDAAIDRVKTAFANSEPLAGWQVDRAAREVIEQSGNGKYFVHRTGHSIGAETHGNGANIDDLETHEERLILPRTCFSIEPGIYQPDFGIRSEVNVFIDGECQVHVTGGPIQTQVHPILSRN